MRLLIIANSCLTCWPLSLFGKGDAGVSLEVLKELMGHRSIQITLGYTKLYETTKRQQYDQAMARIENRQLRLGGQ